MINKTFGIIANVTHQTLKYSTSSYSGGRVQCFKIKIIKHGINITIEKATTIKSGHLFLFGWFIPECWLSFSPTVSFDVKLVGSILAVKPVQMMKYFRWICIAILSVCCWPDCKDYLHFTTYFHLRNFHLSWIEYDLGYQLLPNIPRVSLSLQFYKQDIRNPVLHDSIDYFDNTDSKQI